MCILLVVNTLYKAKVTAPNKAISIPIKSLPLPNPAINFTGSNIKIIPIKLSTIDIVVALLIFSFNIIYAKGTVKIALELIITATSNAFTSINYIIQ